MKKGDIVVVMTMAGEIIGKLVNDRESGITLEDPRTLIQGEGGVGFAKGVCMSGKLDPKIMTINNYVFVTEVNDDFEKAWRQATSGIII
jgi:hypothetical protein